jgi:hypothetical protein
MMKLHQQLAVTDELLVLSTAMAALAAQYAPIPSATGFNVLHGD